MLKFENSTATLWLTPGNAQEAVYYKVLLLVYFYNLVAEFFIFIDLLRSHKLELKFRTIPKCIGNFSWFLFKQTHYLVCMRKHECYSKTFLVKTFYNGGAHSGVLWRHVQEYIIYDRKIWLKLSCEIGPKLGLK